MLKILNESLFIYLNFHEKISKSVLGVSWVILVSYLLFVIIPMNEIIIIVIKETMLTKYYSYVIHNIMNFRSNGQHNFT